MIQLSMYVFTEKDGHALIETAQTVTVDVHYILDNNRLAIPQFLADINEVDSIPAEVQADISSGFINKWCYTQADGFYANPNWVEPPKSVEERLDEVMAYISELEDAICDLDSLIE